uniref:Ig-like domain-containing protein n=1 Tax=Megaselia scalaris TaxID=36166 RepID=T1GPC3_MEGSC
MKPRATKEAYRSKRREIVKMSKVEESGDYKCRPKYPSVTNEDECVDFMVEFVDKNHHITKRMVPVGNGIGNNNGYDVGNENSSVVSTTTVSPVTTTENIAQTKTTTTNNYRRRVVYRTTTKRTRTAIEHFERPNITSLTEGHAIVGSSFTFECTLEYDHNIYLKMQWEFPSHVNVNDNRFYISPATYVTPETKEKKKIKSELTINNVHKDDEGIYKCKVLGNNNETHQSQVLTVMEEGENYLEMKTLDGYEKKNYDISIDNFFQLAVEWKSFPHVPHNHIIWFKDGVEIQNDSNYEISIKNKIIIFRINKVSYNDRGTYTLQLNNTLQRKSRNFTFTVIGKPEVLLSDQYVIEGQQAVMDCTVLSTSEPYIVWEYQKCSLTPEWPTCSKYLKNFNITTERIPTNDLL